MPSAKTSILCPTLEQTKDLSKLSLSQINIIFTNFLPFQHFFFKFKITKKTHLWNRISTHMFYKLSINSFLLLSP